MYTLILKANESHSVTSE